MEKYAEFQAMVQKDARDIATQVYNELGTKFGVAKVPLHAHNGVDSPKLPPSSSTAFIPIDINTLGVVFQIANSLGQGVNYEGITPGVVPIPVIYGGGLISFGDSTTQFDVTNPAGTTFRYTYDGVGKNPLINSHSFTVGNDVVITGTNLNVNNRGTFAITGSGEDYFEVTNAAGVVESNKTIGSGSIETDSMFEGGESQNGTILAYHDTGTLATQLWVKIDSFWFGVTLPLSAPAVL